jgi:hypothetical protein
MVIALPIANSTSSPPQRRFFDFGPLVMFAFDTRPYKKLMIVCETLPSVETRCSKTTLAE